FKGQCFCGAVTIVVTGDPEGAGYCHCASCRSWSAGPVNAFTLWKPEAVKVTQGEDQIGEYHRNERSYRQWCKVCGGHLLTRHPLPTRDTARAMSQENVEIVRAAFDAYFRGDMETLLGLMDPEIVVMQPPEVPDGTTFHGHAGVMEAIAAWPEQWDDYQLGIVQ